MKTSKIATGILTAAIVGTMSFALAACSQSSPASSASTSAGSAAAENIVSEAANIASTAADTAKEAVDGATSNITSSESSASTENASTTPLAPEDLVNVDVAIELGDYDGMQQLASDIQNGMLDGKVVKIHGKVSHFGQGMSYNIVEEKQDGSGNIGTTFVIEGADESTYPEDGTETTLTGIVVTESNGLSHTIHTLPEFVVVNI